MRSHHVYIIYGVCVCFISQFLWQVPHSLSLRAYGGYSPIGIIGIPIHLWGFSIGHPPVFGGRSVVRRGDVRLVVVWGWCIGRVIMATTYLWK